MPLPPELERLARDCDVVAYRSSGPGGQKKNKTESSVRVRHRPTGITRVATESRSQFRNREMALSRVLLELRRRARKPKVRKPTKPSKASVSRRLDAKRRDGDKKRTRRTVDE
jgi:protein subunit release factor B